MTAAVRGCHLLHDRPPFLFVDPYALRLTSPAWRAVLQVPPLQWLIVRKLLAPFRTVHGEMLARARFSEDALQRAVERGVSQYVIIGAGLDSFALRRRDLGGLRVFELDQPATQAVKRRRLGRLGEALPDNLTFVPVDFENETVAEALARSPFDRNRPAFFSWLGVTYYLSPEAVFRTLRAIAGVACPASEIVLDYCVPVETLPPGQRGPLRRLLGFVARSGEPWRSFFAPDALAEAMRQLGYEVMANLRPAEQERLYFRGREDDLRGPEWPCFMHLRLPA